VSDRESPPAGGAARGRAVRVAAPAKLNLVLRILAREATGYHGLESLFVKLALHDMVTVRADVADRTLSVRGPALPPGGLGAPAANLAWRAALAFAEATGWPEGFAIDLEKHIPVGGGLGGGSADAAAVLRGLNVLAPRPLSPDDLLAVAGQLGADVPFLTSDAVLAWTWGRGDRLLPLPALPAMAVTLVAFPVGVDTAAAYAAFAARREAGGGAPYPGAAAYPAGAFASWPAVCALAANDFEQVVPGLHAGVAAWLPRVQAAAAALQAGGQPAIGRLSGSGATCFLLHGVDATAPSGWAVAAPDAPAAGALLLATQTATAIVAPEPTA
jgi:4-diphosphocytidyl-2-C-methyl-D-erythritol kinase